MESATPPTPSPDAPLSTRQPLHYRDIEAADIPSLFRVRTQTRENTYTLAELHHAGITPASVAQQLAGTFKGWLCSVGDEIVGFCMADAKAGELWVIAVLPGHEGCGIGSGLMARAEQWLWQSGCHRAWLTTAVDTQLRAYGFYRHRGWTDWKTEGDTRWLELLPPASTPTPTPSPAAGTPSPPWSPGA